MTSLNKRPRLRWLAPVAVAVLLVGGGAAVKALTAAAGTAALPVRTAAQLLSDVQQAKLGALSGTVVQTSDLGIPDLPGIGGGADSSDLTSLISGTHTLRVWYDGTDKARVALQGRLGESDVIKNGADIWTWSSRDNTATHRTLPEPGTDPATQPGGVNPADLPQTPQAAADAVLKALDPSTVVTTDSTDTVAGRPVYQLTLQPRDTAGSLISSARIAVDAETRIPLRVQVFAVGHPDPAFEVAFSSVDFAAPDAAQFTFNPPPGAQVTDGQTTAPTAPTGPGERPGGVPPTVVGTGWTSVLVGSTSTALSSGSQLTAMTGALPTVSGAWGTGHLFSGTLFSAVLTDDGRIAVGAVQPDLLYAALTG